MCYRVLGENEGGMKGGDMIKILCINFCIKISNNNKCVFKALGRFYANAT